MFKYNLRHSIYMKKAVFGLVLLIMFSFMASSAFAFETVPIVVRPLSGGSAQPSTSFSYVFNFSANSTCTDIVGSYSKTITTDAYGNGHTELDTSDMTRKPQYVCEYVDGTLRKTSNLSTVYANSIVSFNTGNFSSINATGDAWVGGNAVITGTTTFMGGTTIGGNVNGMGYDAFNFTNINATNFNATGELKSNSAIVDGTITGGTLTDSTISITGGDLTGADDINGTDLYSSNTLLVDGQADFKDWVYITPAYNEWLEITKTYVPNQGGVGVKSIMQGTGDGNFVGFFADDGTGIDSGGQVDAFKSSMTQAGSGQLTGWRSALTSTGSADVMGAYFRGITADGSGDLYGWFMDLRANTDGNTYGIYINNELTNNLQSAFHVADSTFTNILYSPKIQIRGNGSIDADSTQLLGTAYLFRGEDITSGNVVQITADSDEMTDAGRLINVTTGTSGDDTIMYLDKYGNMWLNNTINSTTFYQNGNAVLDESDAYNNWNGTADSNLNMMGYDMSNATDVNLTGSLYFNSNGDHTIYGGTTAGNDLELLPNTAQNEPRMDIQGGGNIAIYTAGANSFYVLNGGSTQIQSTQYTTRIAGPGGTSQTGLDLDMDNKDTAEILEISAKGLTSGNALRILLDTDEVTTGKAIQLLSGPSSNIDVFNLDEDGNIFTNSTLQLNVTDTPSISCSAAEEGTMYGDDSLNMPCYCNSTDYVQMDDFSTPC